MSKIFGKVQRDSSIYGVINIDIPIEGTVYGFAINNKGPQGIQGAQGITGTGTQGTQGIQGIQGLIGSLPTYTRSVVNLIATDNQTIFDTTYTVGLIDIYYNGVRLNTNDYTAFNGNSIILVKPAINGDILDVVSFSPGILGAQGITGLQGTQGNQGITGLGSQGIQGTQGTQGNAGSQGTQGSQGIQGITGSQGIQGITGSQGNAGNQGIQGVQGIQGIQGIQGRQGTQGNAGSQGTQGTIGSGTQGTQGIQGNTGAGTQGTQGIQGPGLSYAGLALNDDLNTKIAIGYIYWTNSTTICQSLQNVPVGFISGEMSMEVRGLGSTSYLIQYLICKSGNVSKTFQRTYSASVFGAWVELGTQGIQGIQGSTGAQGSQGTQGTQGIQGIQGRQGTQGNAGSQGTQGTIGSGTQGTQGIQGTQGTIGYVIKGGGDKWSPADNTTYYYGAFPGLAPSTLPDVRRMYIPKAGTIKSCTTFVYTTGVTSADAVDVSLYIRLNNTTDTLASNNIRLTAQSIMQNNGNLNLNVNPSDYIEFKWIGGFWTTNPTNVYVENTLLIQ